MFRKMDRTTSTSTNNSNNSTREQATNSNEHVIPWLVLTPPSSQEAQWNTFNQEHSPLGPAEKFFLPSLSTRGISAHALAETIRQSARGGTIGSVPSTTSDRTDTDDFISCVSNDSDTDESNTPSFDDSNVPDIDKCNSIETEKTKNSMHKSHSGDSEVWAYGSNNAKDNPIKGSEGGMSAHTFAESIRKSASKTISTPIVCNRSKILTPCNSVQESEVSLVETHIICDVNNKEATMLTDGTILSMNGADQLKNDDDMVHLKDTEPDALNTESTETSVEEEDNHYNVSQQLYDSFKAIWGYGSSIRIAKPFLKVTENVADKVLHYATGIHISNEDEEEIIKPKLLELDEKIVNPAIVRLLHAIAPIQDKVDDKLRPVVCMVIRKLHFITYFGHSQCNDN